MRPPVALTIAGSDSGGGAGIQADLKTFAALGVHGASAITAVTAQDTRGVRGVHALPPSMVALQIEAVREDLGVDAAKLGMLATPEIAAAVAEALPALAPAPIVLDPVMVAQSGGRLLEPAAEAVLRERLLPLATLVTPNLPEAAVLLDESEEAVARDPEAAGRALVALGARAVLLKGGHGTGEIVVDVLADEAGVRRFESPRLPTRNTHGTGCTLSAAIAARLAHGDELGRAVEAALAYLRAALAAAADWRLGRGAGPVHHLHAWW